jgi:chromosome segregation ATPase
VTRHDIFKTNAPTDDISNTEAADSLGLADEIEELEDQLIAIERQRRAAEKEARKFEDQKTSLRNTMDHCDDEIERWEALEEKLGDGKTVYAPVAKTRKRKRSSSSTDSEDEDKDKDSDNSDNESQSSDRGPPLTADDIETKIQQLKDQKKEARRGRSEIEAEVKKLKTKVRDFKAEARSIEDKRSRICIAARNQYSKSAIQVDFAAGIKEVSRS